MPPKVGSYFPNLHRDTYEQIERDVVVAVNLMMKAYFDSNGKGGIDPQMSYAMRYAKREGRLYVDFWRGDKLTAKLLGKVDSYDVADFMSAANSMVIVLKNMRKEVIL